MALTYAEVASNLFGRDEFTVRDFEVRTGSDRGAKVLHEMKDRGVAERTGRGRYRMLGPEERPDRRREAWARARDAILSAPLTKMWVGPSAVEVWTGGRYRIESSPFRRTFHVGIEPEEREAWEAYLRGRGVPLHGRKSIGALANLTPREDFSEVTDVNGEPVIGREEVVELIRDHPALYANAEDLLID